MTQAVSRELSQALAKIDRPGSFCASGSVPAVLPGLEVEGLGPIGLPLTARQAEELKARCEQAPYGKGEETVIDTTVRRVWRLTPDRFSLTNPDWEQFLRQTVRKVQEELGLEKQKLQSHLYDLLLYEPGSFFLPHRDGEKLDRMVATLVIVLPSSFQGGELVVRHDGEERTVDFGGDNNAFHIHFAAFYADCEHEIRPLRKGYRLCLVYNLTLAKAKKGLAAPRTSEQVEKIAEILGRWVKDSEPRKLVVTLGHQYTEGGLTWDALKGVDRTQAQALAEAARRAGCQAHLGLLTFHESGSAVDDGGGYYGHRRRWYDDDEDEYDEDDAGLHEMDEVFETSLTAEHLIDPEGNRLPLGPLDVEEDEVLDSESLTDVEPEEDFEGYTGNAGMTLDRWYRHAAILLWPNPRHFEVLCTAGSQSAVEALGQMVKQWQKAGPTGTAALRAGCIDFAASIIARWQENPYGGPFAEKAEPCRLFHSLAAIDDPRLVKAYLGEVLPQDAAVDPAKSLAAVCRKHGWLAFRPELESAFQKTTAGSLARNVRLLEHISLARPGKNEGGAELCEALAPALVAALEGIDQQPAAHDWRVQEVKRADVLAGLARSLLAAEQGELLSRVVAHALARPKKYPLTLAHVAALTALQPWLKKNVTKPCPALADWVAACRQQLEALTAKAPQPPADFRRAAPTSCKCSDCDELRRFLHDPQEQVHQFRAAEHRRRHLEDIVRGHGSDLDLKTERRGSPHTLVCTKNTASYKAQVATFHQDQEYLKTVLAIQASLPKGNAGKT
ncbi:MAG TPA: 2OG-Fe(II) oxygenase family protein [Gemmataceae bacterium]|nr:2OG-Fe(II) oxygenase family protein [Gemmataceae bacterium]